MNDRSHQVFVDQLLALDFRAFLMRVFQEVSPGGDFAPNWHHQAIAWALEEIEYGLNRRLIINVPPRSLKSIIASIAWPAWLLGHDPTRRIVCVSYSGEFSLKLARDCRRVMQTDWYRRVFPRARLSKRTAEHDYETLEGGGRFSTSIDGTLTGRGGDLMIIDDPMNASDTFSETVRKRVIEFYKGTALSRLNNRKTGSFVLVMQRLHEDDLAGHLLSEGDWKHLCLPARTDEDRIVPVGLGQNHHWPAGALLHSAREGSDELADLERKVGSATFNSQWLQRPIPASGLMVKREWLQHYDTTPQREYGDQIIQAWDTASKDGIFNDYSCCITALVRRKKVYVLDVFRARLAFPALKANAIRLAQDWNADVLLIEDAASGTQLLQALRAEEPTGVPSPISRPATTDKVTRFSGQTARIEGHDLIMPKEAPWLAEFLHEILGFPQAKNDDQADALAHLLEWTNRRYEPEVNVGPILYDGSTGMFSDGTYMNDEPTDWDAYLRAWGADC